jgi:hypothetical protein
MMSRATKPPIQSAPKGGKVFLENALEYLGPFPDYAVGQLSKSEARRRIERLARSLNLNFAHERNSLRLGEMIEQLQKSVVLAVGLERHLSSLNDVSRFLVETDGQGSPGFMAFQGKHVQNKAEKKCQDLDKLISDVGAFASHLAFTTEVVKDRFSGVGRNINMHNRLIGIVRIKFIQDGLTLFEEFKPGKASGSVGGPFHKFLLHTFEYACGNDPSEKKAKLGTHLKELVGAYKARKKEEANHENIFERREAMRADPKTKPEALKQIDDEFDQSGKLMQKHWRKYMPQLRY